MGWWIPKFTRGAANNGRGARETRAGTSSEDASGSLSPEGDAKVDASLSSSVGCCERHVRIEDITRMNYPSVVQLPLPPKTRRKPTAAEAEASAAASGRRASAPPPSKQEAAPPAALVADGERPKKEMQNEGFAFVPTPKDVQLSPRNKMTSTGYDGPDPQRMAAVNAELDEMIKQEDAAGSAYDGNSSIAVLKSLSAGIAPRAANGSNGGYWPSASAALGTRCVPHCRRSCSAGSEAEIQLELQTEVLYGGRNRGA
eukprot:gnl/TRDRNA2_/TRDRNA2_127343_c0_seq1.p1 gnl/TRDRNA2_/TRDRNA2_127343_c0~~gnl/TRDRNA2_/TRDRNA2_127343_c0_seq1.p1  ORF type:complete len:257 (-),score=53.31 gnl/TRDRNA2_/TRDRNA2_127343_c0_seq1:190-960(-)